MITARMRPAREERANDSDDREERSEYDHNQKMMHAHRDSTSHTLGSSPANSPSPWDELNGVASAIVEDSILPPSNEATTMNLRPHRLLIPAVFTCAITMMAFAALPPLSPETLARDATLIVTGTVIDSSQTTEGPKAKRDNIYLLKVKIDRVEKGQGVSTGDTLEIRCWDVNSRPDGWAGPGGHRKIPKKDEHSRFWLTKRPDGKWEPLDPNGIEPLPKGAKP
jgi:hypothetical protein